MSNEPTLAATVHYRGRKYSAGMTAEQIGPAAGKLGDHVWVGGVAPAKQSVPEQGAPDGGTPAGSPPVPSPSALPTPPAPEPVPEPQAAGDETDTAAAKKSTGRRAGSGS